MKLSVSGSSVFYPSRLHERGILSTPERGILATPERGILTTQWKRKRAPGMEFVGKRREGLVQSDSIPLLYKREWTEMLKRAPGMEFVGKRVLCNDVIGKRVPGVDFMGKQYSNIV